jgi:hypothetical protein
LGWEHLRQKLGEHRLLPRQLEANRAGLMDLVRPGGLGDFKVLAQAKNVGRPDLWGLQQSPETEALVEGLSFPLLTARHLSLPGGNNFGPVGETEFEAFWPSSDPEPM